VGAIVAAVSGLALLLAGSAAAVARQLREETALAVVVVPEARVLDERGRALGEAPYAEGTEIYVRAADGDLVRVEEASRDVWLRRSDIRTLTPPALGHSTRRNTADLKTTANPKSTADPKTR
jgi:hypothetical protein